MTKEPLFTFDYECATPISPSVLEYLSRVAQSCLRVEGVTLPCTAYILLTDDAGIQKINREQRSIDRATDVLSFPSAPFTPARTAGQAEQLLQREWDSQARACHIGDIVLSVQRAKAQAREYGHSFEREMGYLTAHAMFHLMGYDHMQSQDKEVMRRMEEKALSMAVHAAVTDDVLIARAKEAMQFSYSPYSKFKVGACLLSSDGRMFTGCNIENASYGATNCAERTALFKAVSEGVTHFTTIAITAEKGMPWPCGICRQALNEFAPDLRVIACCGDRIEEKSLTELLPEAFGPLSGTLNYLGKD